MLDDIAVDCTGNVKRDYIMAPNEYAEMQEFARTYLKIA